MKPMPNQQSDTLFTQQQPGVSDEGDSTVHSVQAANFGMVAIIHGALIGSDLWDGAVSHPFTICTQEPP